MSGMESLLYRLRMRLCLDCGEPTSPSILCLPCSLQRFNERMAKALDGEATS